MGENAFAGLAETDKWAGILRTASSVIGNLLASDRDEREGYQSVATSMGSDSTSLADDLAYLESEYEAVLGEGGIVERLRALKPTDVFTGETGPVV
jgi:hypothetical protein